MKKKLLVLLLVLVTVLALGIVAIAADGEETEAETITISYVESRDTMSTTTSLDTTAYENGKQTVGKGEEFTLPKTTSIEYVGQEGYQLVWYTEDGRTYKAGEKVSFNKDTKLFRCVAKECYSMTEVNYAMTNNSYAAILMADITTDMGLDVRDRDMSALVLNGFTINFTRDNDIIGNNRSGKQIIGKGTINVTAATTSTSVSHYILNCSGHTYDGVKNKAVIGRDVTINAPDYWLAEDWDGTNDFYPWIRIYGNVDVYGIMNSTAGPTRKQVIEIYESAVVKINGPQLNRTENKSTNTLYYINNHAVQIRIYGGTFYLPAEAENIAFWTDDYTAEYTVGNVKYTPRELTYANKDIIKISGGSFVLPDNKVPAIASFLKEDVVQVMLSSGNGILKNDKTSVYYVPYYNVVGYKLEFTTYSSSALGTLTVTDFAGNKTVYKYTATKSSDGTRVESITIYEGTKKVENDTETIVYETVTDDLSFAQGVNFFEFKNPITSQDYVLQNLEANNLTYQTVVPAGCEHNFEGTPVDATCEHIAYADYNCANCKHNVYFSCGTVAEHTFEVIGEGVAPTANSTGSKTFKCSACGEVKSYACTINPSTLDVSVVIKNDDGTFETVTVKADEVFEFSTIGGFDTYIYTLTAIKAFGTYNIRNIYGVTIPKGIMYIDITTRNYEKYNNVEYGLVNLTLDSDATMNVHNIGNLSLLEKITIGANSNITFDKNASYYSSNVKTQNLATIDMSAGNHTVWFMDQAFNERSNLKNVIFGENSSYRMDYQSFRKIAISDVNLPNTSTYTLGDGCFRDNSNINSFVLPDNLDLALGANMFYNCANLTSVKFGTGSTYSIGTSCFLKTAIAKVVLTGGSTYTIGSQAFINASLTELDMSAGNMTVVFNASGAFNCKYDNKVYCDLTTIKLGENSNYTFNKESFNYSAITSIVIPKNTTCTFVEHCFNNNSVLETIDASAEGTKAYFNSNSFNGRTTLKTILLGENGTYSFSSDALKSTAVSELNFQNGTTVTFNSKCFVNSSISSLKFGSGMTCTFNSEMLSGKTLTSGIVLGENGNFTFNGDCFKNAAGLTELEIKDGATATFSQNSFRNSNLEKLTLGAGGNYTFNNGSFNYSTKIAEIVIPENSTVLFKDYTLNSSSTITKVDLSASNITATFNASALRNAPKLTTLLVNGNDSTYTFYQESVKGCANIETINLTGENSSYTFSGSSAFADAPKLTELTLGKNSTYVFDQYLVTGSTPLAKFDASADGVNVTFKQSAIRGKTTLTQFLINGKNATYVFNGESIRDSSNIKEIVLGEGSTYTFDKNAFYGVGLTKIDATASNVTATFGNEVFSKSTITYIAFGENSTYTINYRAFYNASPTNDIVFSNTSTFTIGQQAFYSNDFATITFEDGCDVTFTGTNAFFECDKATSLYIGRDIAITNYPFKNFKALETLYIMPGVTNTSEYEFENAGSSDFSTPLYVYNHSTELTFTKGMFNNCDGIILYTATDNIGTRTDVFLNCADGTGYKAWTVYLGIPYPVLVNGDIDPTCEEYGYNTYFCDCGHDCGFYLTETTTVNKYENKHNITDSTEVAEQVRTYEVTPIDPKGHDILGTLLDVVYNSFLEKGTGTYICSTCGKTHTAENAVDAIFEWLGYSTNAEKNEFAIGYRINHEALEQYETLSGNKLVYGVVGAVTENLGGLAPFDEALDPSVKKVSLEAPRANETGDIAEICFRITGFKASHMDLGITMSGYVTETTTDDEGNESSTTVYIQSTQTDNPSSNSINNYLATLPNKEEDEVA